MGKRDVTAPVKWTAFAGFNGVKIILLATKLRSASYARQADPHRQTPTKQNEKHGL
jgi:hypothetical protein